MEKLGQNSKVVRNLVSLVGICQEFEDKSEFIADLYMFLSHATENKAFLQILSSKPDFLDQTLLLFRQNSDSFSKKGMLTFFIFYFNAECVRNHPSTLKEAVFLTLVEEYTLNVPLFIHLKSDSLCNSMILEALLVFFQTLPLETTAKALTNQSFFNKLL